jgi:hypothetical protein
MLDGWRKFGVPVRETGDCERSDKPEDILPEARRCWARPREPSASGWAAGRPLVSPPCRLLAWQGTSIWRISDLLAHAGRTSLDAVAAFDDIGLEGDGSRAAVQLQEEAAGIAEDRARLIATPERRGARGAVLADRLGQSAVCSGKKAMLSIR